VPTGTLGVSTLSLNIGKPIFSVLSEIAKLVERVDPDFFFLQEVHVSKNTKARHDERMQYEPPALNKPS